MYLLCSMSVLLERCIFRVSGALPVITPSPPLRLSPSKCPCLEIRGEKIG